MYCVGVAYLYFHILVWIKHVCNYKPLARDRYFSIPYFDIYIIFFLSIKFWIFYKVVTPLLLKIRFLETLIHLFLSSLHTLNSSQLLSCYCAYCKNTITEKVVKRYYFLHNWIQLLRHDMHTSGGRPISSFFFRPPCESFPPRWMNEEAEESERKCHTSLELNWESHVGLDGRRKIDSSVFFKWIEILCWISTMGELLIQVVMWTKFYFLYLLVASRVKWYYVRNVKLSRSWFLCSVFNSLLGTRAQSLTPVGRRESLVYSNSINHRISWHDCIYFALCTYVCQTTSGNRWEMWDISRFLYSFTFHETHVIHNDTSYMYCGIVRSYN